MLKKRALITGINGQDGSHLADFLLKKDYEVFGLERERNRINTQHLEGKITFFTGCLTDQKSLLGAIEKSNPDEIYNLASQSFPFESWKNPEETTDITALGVLRLLEAIRSYGKKIKFFQAGSSEMYARNVGMITEVSPILPVSPYGVSKAAAYWYTKIYRETYDMFNCNGILFSHDSERRGFEFVTRKITDGIAKIYLGIQKKIYLGNLETSKDFGYAPDTIEAIYLMLQRDMPGDYIVATGQAHSLKDILNVGFSYIGIKDWQEYVGVDKKYYKDATPNVLIGDNTKIKEVLGWSPRTSFQEIIVQMVKSDIERLQNE